MNKIMIYPEDELKAWLDEAAKRKKLSMNKLIIKALNFYKKMDTFRMESIKKNKLTTSGKVTERRKKKNDGNC